MSFIYGLQSTWNNPAQVFEGIQLDISNGSGGIPSYATGSQLLNLKNNGSAVFSIDPNGYYFGAKQFNVMRYGAVPNTQLASATNDTAFQACADAINTNGGGEFYVPPGVFWKRKGTTIYSNTQVKGAGWSSNIKADATNWVGVVDVSSGFFTNKNFTVSALTDSNILVSDISFDYSTVPGAGLYSVYLRYVNRVNISNIYSTKGGNATALLACKDTYIYASEVDNVNNCGFDHWDGIDSSVVAFCTVRNSLAQGIQYTGTSTTSGARTSARALFMGNKVFGVRSAGGGGSAIIFNPGAANSLTTKCMSMGNYIEDCDFGLVYEGLCNNHTSHGDVLYNVDKQPIFLKEGSVTSIPTNCVIDGLHLIDCNHTAGFSGLIAIGGNNNIITNVVVTNTGSPAYQYIAGFTPASTNCQISIDNAATGTVGRVQNPGAASNQVFDPVAWIPFTSTITSFTGAITSASGSGRYRLWGKTCEFNITASIITNGTGATYVLATLPFTAFIQNVDNGVGRDATDGTLLQWFAANTTQAFIVKADNTYPGVDGHTLCINGTYEIA